MKKVKLMELIKMCMHMNLRLPTILEYIYHKYMLNRESNINRTNFKYLCI